MAARSQTEGNGSENVSRNDPGTEPEGEEEPKEKWTTEQRHEIMRRRALLLAEWATAATQIGEGSNAISSAFYDRVEAFVSAANSAYGSMGGASAIADTDRFVLFEITRGAALSAIHLGLKAAMNLKELDDVKVPVKTEKVDYGVVQVSAESAVQALVARSH